MKKILLATVLAAMTMVANSATVESWREGTSNSIYVVITSDINVNARCAGYNTENKPIVVSGWEQIEAPLGEIFVYGKGVGANSKTVKCWFK